MKRNTGNDDYIRSVIETDIEESEEMEIRSSAILLLSNLAAEGTTSIVRAIL
jgi:hypothetical protein